MNIEIKHKVTGAILWTGEAYSLKAGVEKAVSDGANLYGASLEGASLYRANLYGANLEGANLYGANLEGANLYRANLEGASLYRANLYGASLDDNTRLDTGETWGEYLTLTLPSLLVAGGKSLASFKDHWTCHEWDNCPMAHGFDVRSERDCPILLRPRVRQFVQLFDAKLIPWEVVQKIIDQAK